ncbi:hypothetical protein KIW84_045146 [Lathyrus oleraceus]|uniref:Endonuclease/exonuclease/phosphatase n=1 Tax=Pisum sativum TaxID=3888 RepID=A0A9D4XMD8_PEA|nr:hypothetical protein KIW84_045146 [Pisum sativum]
MGVDSDGFMKLKSKSKKKAHKKIAARGLANFLTKLTLKRLVMSSKPQFVFIAESWMGKDLFPHSLLSRLNLKKFVVNSKEGLLPNLRCRCDINLTPEVIQIDDQQVSFTILVNGYSIGISVVYALTSYITRRNLWNSLQNILQTYKISWCFMVDFNIILGAHEYDDPFGPARGPMDEFSFWSDQNHLIHMPTVGAKFTWSNGRNGSHHTRKRLDKVICNQAWINSFVQHSCSSLIKSRSNHFPILLHFIFHDFKFKYQFRFLQMWTTHQDCIKVVESSWKTNFVGCHMFVLASKLRVLKDNLRV